MITRMEKIRRYSRLSKGRFYPFVKRSMDQIRSTRGTTRTQRVGNLIELHEGTQFGYFAYVTNYRRAELSIYHGNLKSLGENDITANKSIPIPIPIRHTLNPSNKQPKPVEMAEDSRDRSTDTSTNPIATANPTKPEVTPNNYAATQPATLSEAVKTIHAEDFKKVHLQPCVRNALLYGIAAGFAFGGLKIVLRGLFLYPPPYFLERRERREEFTSLLCSAST